jgi:N utilization substance protein B
MEYIIAMTEKTLKKFSSNPKNEIKLMPLFKSKEDAEFVKTLFVKAILGYEKSSDLIDRNTANWEIERIALMDILVMKLAITEIIEFSEVPVKVTLNEYIEIAKYYCTSKSSTFVNGILDKIVKEMRDKSLFKKHGRGLIGEENE